MLRGETLPKLLLGLALAVRDTLQLHNERAVEHVAALGGYVDAIEDHGPPELDNHVLIVGVEAALAISLSGDKAAQRIRSPLGDGVLVIGHDDVGVHSLLEEVARVKAYGLRRGGIE